jgi:hypothetical protein
VEALSIYLQENMHMESICVFPTGGLAQKYRPCRTASGMNNPVPVSLLSGDRKPQIRFLGNHHSGSGNLYHKSFRM